jgi:DNA adenine methylase
LAKYIEAIRARGANYILTNAAHPVIDEIFDLGARKVELNRASLIGGKKAKRGHVIEYLFTSLEIDTE